MACGRVEFSNFYCWLGSIYHCTNKNVDDIKLIKLLFFEGIKTDLFAHSACRLIQNLLQIHLSPRTWVGKHWYRLTKILIPCPAGLQSYCKYETAPFPEVFLFMNMAPECLVLALVVTFSMTPLQLLFVFAH